jgi:hypothetical protein
MYAVLLTILLVGQPCPQFVPVPAFVPVPHFAPAPKPAPVGHWESRCGPNGCQRVWIVEAKKPVVKQPMYQPERRRLFFRRW